MALSVKAVSNHPDGRRRISQTPLTVTGTFSQLVTSRCGVCIIVMQSDLVRGIDLAYAERTDPLVFALTGRTGSGCTTAANTLAKSYDEITLSDGDPDDVETRKLGIATEFARSQWHPFSVVTVSSVIFSFLLQQSRSDVDSFLSRQRISASGHKEFNNHLDQLGSDPRYPSFQKSISGDASREDEARGWDFFLGELHVRAQQTKRVLEGGYPPLFQKLGDNIRFSGSPLNSTVQPDNLFQLMRRVRVLVDCAISHQRSINGSPVRIAIDAIRNPLELVYLRRHLPGLYVLAITADDAERKQRLIESGLNKKDIDELDKKEYPETKHLEDYASFVSQNLKDCIQKSDVFIANPGPPGALVSTVKHMNQQLIRYVALSLRPGLVTPTRDERCMQIAFVAKLNSGCISRQVGAVVADQEYSIHAIGWNDTPKGQTSCLLRDVDDLLGGRDDDSFSYYEKTDSKLRTQLQTRFSKRNELRAEKGLSCPFCFRDAYNTITREKNQVHTRSLHAEENAFLQVAKRGSVGVGGGVLYTTASPCELCSKKAYQLGIRDIVYVDPYPGISSVHILKSGPERGQPKLRLFSGAVGHAYHRLYESLLSIKDELGARLAG
jgi:deoxycytidylate deaminase/dephospho-CoA kinase